MSSTFNWIKYFADFRFSISIKKSCLKCPICFREVLGPLIFGNNKIDKLCTTNWFQLKEETSFNCANCKHPMCLKAHRQNGDGCIWRVFPMYMLYVNYIFNNVKNGRVHFQGSAHYAPKIEYYILSCRPETVSLKKMLTVKKFSHESERLKISCQDLSVSYLVAWYYGKSRQT